MDVIFKLILAFYSLILVVCNNSFDYRAFEPTLWCTCEICLGSFSSITIMLQPFKVILTIKNLFWWFVVTHLIIKLLNQSCDASSPFASGLLWIGLILMWTLLLWSMYFWRDGRIHCTHRCYMKIEMESKTWSSKFIVFAYRNLIL
jgi:hypothetical protein